MAQVMCEVCGESVELDGEGRFKKHGSHQEGPWVGPCETSGLFPVSGYPTGSVHEVPGGQWESKRRKH